jgi:hypothetical protein
VVAAPGFRFTMQRRTGHAVAVEVQLDPSLTGAEAGLREAKRLR